MAYNVTTRQQNQAAMRDIREKLRREAIIAAALISGYFKPVSKFFFNEYKRTGAVPDLADHHANLSDILNRQYFGTSKKFISQVRDALGKPENAEAINEAIEFNRDLLQSVDIFVSGNSIATTTEKSLQDTVNKIIQEAQQQEIELSNLQVAKLAKKKFDSLTQGRVDTISMTQTQQASEGSKHTELSVLQQNNAIFPLAAVALATATLKKTWHTMLDSRVRHAHSEAELQTVNFNDPYTVGGQLLMYPGDTSLGATPGNIINCRCASIKTIIRG